MMDRDALRKCLSKMLTRIEPGLLVPAKPWSPEIQKQILQLDAGSPPEKAVKSGLLLWNDDLDGSHTIAQDLDDRHGAYLHGIMHRREPDYSNAKYWFHKVGEHPLFPQLRLAAIELLEGASGLETRRRDIQATVSWDPFRMIDWCESAGEEIDAAFLRTIQAVEIQGLVYYWLDQAGLPRPA